MHVCFARAYYSRTTSKVLPTLLLGSKILCRLIMFMCTAFWSTVCKVNSNIIHQTTMTYVPAVPVLVLTLRKNVWFSGSDSGGLITTTQTRNCPMSSRTLYDGCSNPTSTPSMCTVIVDAPVSLRRGNVDKSVRVWFPLVSVPMFLVMFWSSIWSS